MLAEGSIQDRGRDRPELPDWSQFWPFDAGACGDSGDVVASSI
jgi:hypothetical protein